MVVVFHRLWYNATETALNLSSSGDTHAAGLLFISEGQQNAGLWHNDMHARETQHFLPDILIDRGSTGLVRMEVPTDMSWPLW